MATSLVCPNCNEDLGKDKENAELAFCGNCGNNFYNRYGYKLTEDDFMSKEAYEAAVKKLSALKTRVILRPHR